MPLPVERLDETFAVEPSFRLRENVPFVGQEIGARLVSRASAPTRHACRRTLPG